MLAVLKIIGFVLLGILAFILLLVLLVLFFPFTYHISGAKPREEEGSPYGKAVLSWLFHILHISFVYDKEGPLLKVRVFGIPVYKTDFEEPPVKEDKSSKKKRKKKEEDPEGETKQEEDGDESLDGTDSTETNEIPEEQEQSVDSESEDGSEEDDEDGTAWGGTIPDEEEEYDLTDEEIEAILNEPDGIEDLPLPKKIKLVLKKIKEFILKLKEKCYNLKKDAKLKYRKMRRTVKLWKHYWKLLNHPSVKPLLKFFLKQVWKIIKHVRPRKIRINAEYGSEDPQACARVYGYYCMIYPFFGKQIKFVPVFDEDVFAIDGYVKGRFLVIRFVWFVILVLLNRNFWKVLRLLIREVKRRGRK